MTMSRYIQDEKENPLPHVIKLNKKHLFIYGENGTGKSSFCDAMEWCLTGKLVESENRRINDKALLINKFCPDQKTPFVEISYIEKEIPKEFRRDAKGRKTSFDYEDEAEACLIDSSRIEHFVIDTKNSKWERFSSLLGFDDLIDFENRLIRLRNHADNKCKELREKSERDQYEFGNLNDEIIELERVFTNEFGDNWLDTIGSHEKSNHIERYTYFKNLSTNIKDYIDKNNELEMINTKINELEIHLNEEKGTSPISEISQIIEASFNYFENLKDLKVCPVCGVTGGLKMLNSGGLKMSTCQSQRSKLGGCVDVGPGGVPHAARSIQRWIEHKRDRQKNRTLPWNSQEIPALSSSASAPEEIKEAR